jgi:hypothetical protein
MDTHCVGVEHRTVYYIRSREMRLKCGKVDELDGQLVNRTRDCNKEMFGCSLLAAAVVA